MDSVLRVGLIQISGCAGGDARKSSVFGWPLGLDAGSSVWVLRHAGAVELADRLSGEGDSRGGGGTVKFFGNYREALMVVDPV